MSHQVYIFTTRSLSKRSIAEVDGETFFVKLKLGETMLDADDRIAQQDSTSAAERLDRIFKKEVPAHITDKVWHRAMQKAGYAKARDDKNREWFVFPDCLTADEAKRVSVEILMDLVHGRRAIEDFEPDAYQVEFAKWASQRWNDGAEELLNGSKMRSGKCLMGHLVTDIMNFSKVLVVTGKPGALKGWGELLVGGEKAHIKFADNNFFHYKDQQNKPVNFSSQRNTVAVGMQWIHNHTKSAGNPLLAQIFETEWDAVYVDECHSAADTKLALTFFSKLNVKNNRILNFSGTPFKVLMSGNILPENRWAWDYIKEQKHRAYLLAHAPNSDQAKRFKYLPKVSYALMHVPAKVKALLNGDRFNLGANGIWAVDKKTNQYIFAEAVNELVAFVRAQGYKNVPPVFKPYVDRHTRHSFWLLPDNVRAIKLLRDLLKQHPYFKKFQIIVASGNEIKDDTAVNTAITRVEQGISKYHGTITLSCGRLVEGTTIPEWFSVHQLNSDKSVTSYFQSSFRAGSPCPDLDKQEVCVYDYDPERFLQAVYELAIDSCDRGNGQSPCDWIETEWNGVSDVYDFDSRWKLLSGKAIIQKATSEIAGNPNIFCDISLVDASQITATHVAAMSGLDYSNTQSGQTTLNDNGLEIGTVSNVTRAPSLAPGKKLHDDVTVTRLRIIEAVKRIPNLIYISYDYAVRINSVYDITKCCDINVVKEQTGLTVEQWACIINTLNIDKLNRRIDAYVNA